MKCYLSLKDLAFIGHKTYEWEVRVENKVIIVIFFQQCLGNTSCKKMFSFGHCPNYLSLFYRRCSLLLCFWPKDIQKKTNQTLCPISIFRENSSDVTCRQALFLLIPNMGFQWSLSHLHIQPSSLWSFNLFPPIQTFTYNSVILLITKVTSSVRCYTSSQRPSTHFFTRISSVSESSHRPFFH